MERARSSIAGWRHQGALLLELLQLLDELELYKYQAYTGGSPAFEHLLELRKRPAAIAANVSGAATSNIVLQTVSECLLEAEAELKAMHFNTSIRPSAANDALLSEATIAICPNQELVRRTHHRNQLDILTRLREVAPPAV